MIVNHDKIEIVRLLVRNVLIFYDSVPDDYKKNPGAVEAIAEQPGHPDNILIGYNRGLMVLWNKATPGAQQVSLHIYYFVSYAYYAYKTIVWQMQ